jgi:N,N'-diacetyllegionaminate synthase
MRIGNKDIGSRTYVIAEFGVNHNGSLERAKEAIIKAAKAGADAIKFQTYTADELVVKGTPKFWDAESKVDEGLNQHEAYKALEGFKYEWYPELIQTCKENNIEFLSTPFSFEAADYLNSIGMAAFKVASSDMSVLPYLEHIAKYGKPIILSTGASTLEEVKQAVETIEKAGNDQIIILHCTLKYPTPEKDANLNIIQTFKKVFPWHPIGISDHTMGAYPSYIAMAMGACVIEKHYTVDKTLDKSADHWLSVDPEELKDIVDNVRRIEVLKGSSEKCVFTAENETRMYDKRSIVSKVDIADGEEITRDKITFKRPGTGLWPEKMDKILGRVAKGDIKADTTLQWEHFRKK